MTEEVLPSSVAGRQQNRKPQVGAFEVLSEGLALLASEEQREASAEHVGKILPLYV